ncbi:MAG: recombinase family protein, partial [Planctomycetota bacterium]
NRGMRAMAEELNAEGIPSPRGGHWGVGTIRSILVNPGYYGANVWNVRSFSKYHAIKNGKAEPSDNERGRKRINKKKDWIVADPEYNFPALVSKELFDQAQAKRKSRRRNPARQGRAAKAPFHLTGILVCSRCGHHLHGKTKTSGKKKGFKKYPYYICGGFVMKGGSVCDRYLVPRDLIEQAVREALNKHLRSLARLDSIRRQLNELITEYAGPAGETRHLRRKMAEIEKKRGNWEKAIDKGVNMDRAVKKLEELDSQYADLERELKLAGTREAIDIDVQTASKEMLGQLDELQQKITEGSVAEVKAIMEAYIHRIEYDPETNRARIGFYDLPTPALLSRVAPENATHRLVAGAGCEPATSALQG